MTATAAIGSIAILPNERKVATRSNWCEGRDAFADYVVVCTYTDWHVVSAAGISVPHLFSTMNSALADVASTSTVV